MRAQIREHAAQPIATADFLGWIGVPAIHGNEELGECADRTKSGAPIVTDNAKATTWRRF
jgi:hypothetical protein